MPSRTLDDFDDLIDPALVAQQPCEPRDAARLLVLSRGGGSSVHAGVRDVPALLERGDCLVVNATRVFARPASRISACTWNSARRLSSGFFTGPMP